MPAPVAPAAKRTSLLLTLLFWAGVALAPLAALILLVADGGGTLRIGAVLAILAVVLIGLSIALRADGSDGAAGAEELRDEIEQLRRELRSEVVAAAQRGNQALDQAHRTQETVTALHRRLDAAAAEMAAAATSPAPAREEPAGARARMASAEAYDDRRSRHSAPAAQPPAGGGQPSGREEEPVRRPQPGTRYGSERPQPGVYGASRAAEPDARPEPRSVGVVHHTETVHVTTRHTIVDGPADPATGARYGGHAGRWSPGPEERSWAGAEPEERPRSGYREAEDDRGWSGGDNARPAQGGHRDGGSWSGPDSGRAPSGRRASWDETSRSGDHPAPGAVRTGDGAGSGDNRGWTAGPGDDSSWSTSSAGPRSRPAAPDGPADERSWPAGRDGRGEDRSAGLAGSRDEGSWAGRAPRDGRGWAGEDRASSDGRAWAAPEPSGPATAAEDPDGDYWSELRVGNRWASVRDDEHGREIRVGERRAAVHAAGAGTEYRVEDRWASVHEPHRDRGAPVEAGSGWAGESRPALPAGGVPVPDEWRPPTQRSGQPEWRRAEAEPEPVRYGDERYGYPPRDDAPRSADRWR
ncbi:hypothetical protein [Micromonospora sp. SL4-19]|uniref:hypothetical protein n=1 Tax=Micromonospora sp. SL4-19 TaxID=3399129 RepID=UPI003A4E2281